MRNPLRTYRDWRTARQAKRREQRTKERLILGAAQSGRDLLKTYAALRFLGISDEARQQVDGIELTCLWCHKTYRHDHRRCTLGFCPRCSKP